MSAEGGSYSSLLGSQGACPCRSPRESVVEKKKSILGFLRTDREGSDCCSAILA
jgi:hypothetical protein